MVNTMTAEGRGSGAQRESTGLCWGTPETFLGRRRQNESCRMHNGQPTKKMPTNETECSGRENGVSQGLVTKGPGALGETLVTPKEGVARGIQVGQEGPTKKGPVGLHYAQKGHGDCRARVQGSHSVEDILLRNLC